MYEDKDELNIVIVGLGGIGSILVENLSRFLNYSSNKEFKCFLVDGDTYEERNKERQEFEGIGNKAEIKVRELEVKFQRIQYDSISKYVNEENIDGIINEDDIVFICVDNHKTRKLISDYCTNLNNIVLISGGNELDDGNVQTFFKLNGDEIICPITKYHKEIKNPTDRSPDEIGCDELIEIEPQIHITNLFVATIMYSTFYNIFVDNNFDIVETYFQRNPPSMLSYTKKERP